MDSRQHSLRRMVLAVSSFFLPLSLFAQGGGGGARSQGFFTFLQRPKFVTMLVIGLVALVLLLTKRMTNGIKVPILLLSTFLYGIAANLPLKIFSGFSMHPSPICAATKSVLYGFRIPMIVTLAVILLLTIVGPKLFCGWVCPVGAVQELIAMLADKLGLRRRKWNFRFTQTVRVGLLLLFIFLSGTAILYTVQNDQKTALSLYDYINAFHGFEISAQPTLIATLIHFLPFILTLGFALKYYRPFCYLVCPIGLLTHLLEPIALFRVHFKRSDCTDCTLCTDRTPCPAVPEIMKGAVVRPDCFSCTSCVRSCPSGSFAFGIRVRRKS